jgi:hypothetical protein
MRLTTSPPPSQADGSPGGSPREQAMALVASSPGRPGAAPPVERLGTAREPCLAILVRSGFAPEQTTFVTPPEHAQQLGFIVYRKGDSIPRHVHLPVTRTITQTPEVITVRSGSCEVALYDGQRQFVASRRLAAGDVIILLSGGHGFHMLEDTVLVEVKQGPYAGVMEKERF